MKYAAAFLITLLSSCLAWAHLPDRPDLDSWAMSLQNGRGSICCDFTEAQDLADADWDTTLVAGKPHYRVKFHEQWLIVDDESVVVAPNRYGAALAWIVYLDGKPWVKCFLKGTEI